MTLSLRASLLVLLTIAAGWVAGCAASAPPVSGDISWNVDTAAAYLDRREAWWMEWPGAARDHETFCVSCHTVLPYALSRPALRAMRDEDVRSDREQQLLENVTKRVRLWDEVRPYYGDEGKAPHAAESRSTEAILNALILTSFDADDHQFSKEAQLALDHLLALQQTAGALRGAWEWLNFGFRPWESRESGYYGAALAAAALGNAPEAYRERPNVRASLDLLQDYFKREYAVQSLYNRTMLLWASMKLPALMEHARQQSVVADLRNAQAADGGWSLPSLSRSWSGSTIRSYTRSWIRSDKTWVDSKSDAYATGIVVFTLLQSGVSPHDATIARGLAWLARAQDKLEGNWVTSSLNVRRDPDSDIGRFMSDAATAYAVMALSQAAVVHTQTSDKSPAARQ